MWICGAHMECLGLQWGEAAWRRSILCLWAGAFLKSELKHHVIRKCLTHRELKISDCDTANFQGSRRMWEQAVGQWGPPQTGKRNLFMANKLLHKPLVTILKCTWYHLAIINHQLHLHDTRPSGLLPYPLFISFFQATSKAGRATVAFVSQMTAARSGGPILILQYQNSNSQSYETAFLVPWFLMYYW